MPQKRSDRAAGGGAAARTRSSRRSPDGAVAPTVRVAAVPPDSAELRRRVVIEGIKPEIDDGRFPVKRVVGDIVVVEADVFADGHQALACRLLYRRRQDAGWSAVPMRHLGNDRWRGEFAVTERTPYVYTLEGWIDEFESWRQDTRKFAEAGEDVTLQLLIGVDLLRAAAARAPARDATRLREAADGISGGDPLAKRTQLALSEELAALARRYADMSRATRYERELEVWVDVPRAAFSTWYEMFPRSAVEAPGKHGAFADVEKRLPYVAQMGFDVLYLPPIHPVGHTQRKGKNNALLVKSGDPGSPWAIGSEAGGHKAIEPKLGTAEDFRRLVGKAREMGIEVALDIAFQCSPDHPYLKEHPEWFRTRPDGSVQYAQNPPKKYEDIYPLDFETPNWRELWDELKSIFLYWIEQGVRFFRVDNPHTKPFRFWEWCIADVRKEHPDVIFLSEAFTRPKVMYHLAKLGFTQSYTYFTWRNTKWELTEYFTELTQTDVAEYFRPNAWPNTPDILHAYLQTGGRPAFIARLVLAATLSANYGIYGPAFELMERTPREAGSEEYLNSEKYEIKHWNIKDRKSLRGLIARVNRARHENPALQSNASLRFHHVDNDQLICYSKTAGAGKALNVVVTVVNLDPRYTQSGWVQLPIDEWRIGPEEPFVAHDLLTEEAYQWHGPVNFVQLNPHEAPAHIMRLERAGG